jgi:hypothetical protein
MQSLTNDFKTFFTFKANQHFRTTGSTMDETEAAEWLKNEVVEQTELVKGWVREFNATGAK